MVLYQIVGKRLDGSAVHEEIEAEYPRQALRKCLRKHGRLRRRYDIYISDYLDAEDIPENEPLAPLTPTLTDEEVFAIAAAIRNSTANQEEYAKFKSYFRPMVKSAVYFLWQGVSDLPSSDIEDDLTRMIATEFMPRLDGRGTFRRFIKMNVHSRLIKLWSRKKYVNGNKGMIRSDIERDYVLAQVTPIVRRDPDEIKETLVRIVLHMSKTGRGFTLKQKQDFYGLIVENGFHREWLKRKRQIEAIERCYGADRMTGAEYGTENGFTQQNAQKAKSRGEHNILKYIKKELVGL